LDENYSKLLNLFECYKSGSIEIRNHKLLGLYHLVYDECLTIEKNQSLKFEKLNEIEQFLIDRGINDA